MNDMPPMICGICRTALDFHMDARGAGWQHSLQDLPADHDPDPMPAPADWLGRCDFCNVGVPTHIVPSRSFVVPGDPPQASEGDWNACAACARLIEIDDWGALLNRVAGTFHEQWGRSMPGVVRQRVDDTWVQLRAHITGPLRPIVDNDPDAPGQSGPPAPPG